MSETSTDSQRTLSDHGKQDKSFSLAKSMEFWVSYKDCCYWKADVKTMDFFTINSFPEGNYFPPSPISFPYIKLTLRQQGFLAFCLQKVKVKQ